MATGYLDHVSRIHVAGWAHNGNGGPAPLDLLVDGKLRLTFTPDKDRPDVPPKCGFHVILDPVCEGAVVSVVDHATGTPLTGSPKVASTPNADWLDIPESKRVALTTHFLKGTGIEIGALSHPVAVPLGVTVKYVDRMSVADLRRQYPELGSENIVAPDYICDGERLEAIPNASQDFVIASHVIEHMPDPILCLKSYLRVLKDHGIIYLAVPDKRHTFDKKRMLTPVEHLIADHEIGPHISRASHFVEFAQFCSEKPDIFGEAQRLAERDYSIHYHTWTPTSFVAFLDRLIQQYRLPLNVEAMVTSPGEFLLVLRKQTN